MNTSSNNSFKIISNSQGDITSNGNHSVLSNITCRVSNGSNTCCAICKKEHSTSSHAEIELLLEAVPRLNEVFLLKQKIGEGTFSCVYLAMIKPSMRNNANFNNKYVALKHIVPTSIPGRILIELECMQKFGCHPNIIGIRSCLRQGCHVIMVMPYFHHDKFSDYVGDMDLQEIKEYIRNLLEALQYVHRGGVIHRDVKPSNFLYNRKLKRFALVDFGLAQRVTSAKGTGITETNFKMPKQGTQVSDSTEYRLSSAKPNKTFLRLLPASQALGSSQNASHHQLTIRAGDVVNKSRNSPCNCHRMPQICRSCSSKPVQPASRAGTPGFRPPEVLLKHPHQTTAVDIWSAGVIFLCLLTERYPFFYGNDDFTALAEITTIFGSEAMKEAANKLGKVLLCAPEKSAIKLETICENLREPMDLKCETYEQRLLAYDLLGKMLEVNQDLRSTASDALLHPFLKRNAP